MGCISSKNKNKVYESEVHSAKLKDHDEIDEIARLPFTLKDDEHELLSAVELSFKCNDLPEPNRNPLCILYSEQLDKSWKESGTTEIQMGTLNPAFVSCFKVTYSFEKQMQFRVDVYNAECSSGEVRRQIYLGSAYFSIHELVCSPSHSLSLSIRNPRFHQNYLGSITVFSEEIKHLKSFAKMQWQVERRNLRGHLFLKLNRCSLNLIPVYQTEAKSSSVCIWEPFEVSLNQLCKGDFQNPIKAELYQFQRSHIHKLIGVSEFSLADLKDSSSFTVENTGKQVAVLQLVSLEIVESTSFLDYVLGGCEISLIVGIDFTKSNGIPTDYNSLHYYYEQDPDNEYIQAINAVGEILQYYDSDKKIPIYGFGAKLPPKFDVVSHCFALNGNIFTPEVTGIDEALEVYRNAIYSVKFHGPTIFHELIQNASAFAESCQNSQESQQYSILLILTDGMINDMERTIDEIVKASELPLSIIIVGVGNEDFSMMKLLDADVNPLFSKKYNKHMVRDIVQFVPFANFKSDPRELAREVLYEVPHQLVSYMKSKNIKPKKFEYEELTNSNYIGNMLPTRQALISRSLHKNLSVVETMKAKVIEEVVGMGYDRQTVAKTVEQGIPCLDSNIVVQLMNLRGVNTKKSNLRRRTKKFVTIGEKMYINE